MSSVLAVGDLLFNDLLSELNIKPWWEKFRGYCFAATVASALFATYIILDSSETIDCYPFIKGNMSSKFPVTQASFVNTHCSNQIPRYVNLAGIISLMCAIFILVASTWWLHIPKVISAFRTFALFGKDIEDLKLTSKQLGKYCSKIYEPGISEEARALRNFRKTCNLLWKYESSIDVDRYYCIRNVILLFITTVSAMLSLTFLAFLVYDKNNFKCSLDISDEYNIYGTIELPKLYLCSYNTSKKLLLVMIFSSLSLIAQVVFISIGIYITTSNNLNVDLSSLSAKALKAFQFSSFMINIWENSRPCGSGPLRNLIECMFNRALSDMFAKIDNAISKNDNEMISIYSCVRKNGGNKIISVMMKIVERKDLTTSLYHSTVNAVDHLDSIDWGDDTKKFIDYLFKEKYWQLFVHVLFAEVWTGLESDSKINKFETSIKTNTDEIGESGLESQKKEVKIPIKNDNINTDEIGTFQTFIESLNINTDEIGEFHLDTHRPSILYYVIKDKLRYFQMAPQYNNPGYCRKYVHFDGKREFISDVLKKHCYSEIPEIEGVISFPAKVFFNCTECLESGSLKAIENLFNKHEDKTKSLKTQPTEYFKYQKEIAVKLSRLKFSKWNTHTKNIAEFLRSNKQWVVLVELLNAFEVLDSSAIDFNCDVDNFVLTDLDANGASILYYAMNKPFYLRDGQAGKKKCEFVYTAFQYILKCTDNEKKVVVIDPRISKVEWDAVSYTNNICLVDVDENTKKNLQLILKKRSTIPVGDHSNKGDNIPGTSGSGVTQKLRLHSSSMRRSPISVADQLNVGDDIPATSGVTQKIHPHSSSTRHSPISVADQSNVGDNIPRTSVATHKVRPHLSSTEHSTIPKAEQSNVGDDIPGTSGATQKVQPQLSSMRRFPIPVEDQPNEDEKCPNTLYDARDSTSLLLG